MDRSFGTSFFLSDIFIQGEVLHYQGGSPVFYEHLFWFLGHPEVYIVLLPALGNNLRDYCYQCKKTYFWLSCNGCFYFGNCLFVHHCLGTPYVYFRNESIFGIGVYIYNTIDCHPSAVKAFNYITTLWKGKFTFNPSHAIFNRSCIYLLSLVV